MKLISIYTNMKIIIYKIKQIIINQKNKAENIKKYTKWKKNSEQLIIIILNCI